MVVQFDVVTFAKDATNVDGATQVVQLSIDPKAVILVSDGNTLSNTISDHYQFIYGYSDGTNHACVSYTSDDADAAADVAGIHRNDAIYSRLDEVDNATESARATITFLNKSVRVTWTVNDSVATLITLYVFGGDDIKNVKVNTVTIGSVGTGVKNYTGLGFNPEGAWHTLFGFMSAGLTTLNTVSSAAVISNGFCANFTNSVGGSNEVVMSNSIEDAAATMDTYSALSGGFVMLIPNTTTGAFTTNATSSSLLPDGFSLSYGANGGATINFSYIVINGGTYVVLIPAGAPTSPQLRTDLIPTTAGQNYQSKTIRGLIIYCNGDAASGTVAHAKMSFGGTDGVRTACMATIDEDAVADADSYRINAYNDGAVFKGISVAGALEVNANFVGFGQNQVVLNFTTSTIAKLYTELFIMDHSSFPPAHSFGKINTYFDNNLGPAIFG